MTRSACANCSCAESVFETSCRSTGGCVPTTHSSSGPRVRLQSRAMGASCDGDFVIKLLWHNHTVRMLSGQSSSQLPAGWTFVISCWDNRGSCVKAVGTLCSQSIWTWPSTCPWNSPYRYGTSWKSISYQLRGELYLSIYTNISSCAYSCSGIREPFSGLLYLVLKAIQTIRCTFLTVRIIYHGKNLLRVCGGLPITGNF